MTLDKAILHHKEKRKPYYDSRAVDYLCRNHGSCVYCTGNRLYKFKKQVQECESKLKELE